MRGGLTLAEALGLMSLCLGDVRIIEEGAYHFT